MRRTIISVLSLFLSLSTAASSTLNSPYPPDAVSLLSFKSTADLDNKLLFNLNERYDYCQWRGVKCVQGRVIRLSLDGYGLRGVLETNTLSMLDQLRVLSLRNNSLFGLIPDLSPLFHLKSLFLGDNHFSGAFPPSILKIHRIREIDLSYNNFSGPIPVALKALDWIEHLRLESNRFNGSIPPLNQTLLNVFNVSGNDLFGLVPRTLTLSRFNISSFLLNPKLCGKVVNRDCYPPSPFFNPSPSTKAVSPPSSKAPSADSQGTIVTYSPPPKKHTELILGFTFGAALLIFLLLLVFLVFKKQNTRRRKYRESKGKMSSSGDSVESKSATDHKTDSSPMNTSVKPEMKLLAVQEVRRVPKSGNLVFCSGETRCYTLEQLMRASAELLGRGTIGTTYKAVLDNQLILSVKRLDAIKTAMTSGDAFKRNMELVGGLRHPKLVPVRAYFQAEEERLIVYDYHPNGSLFKLIHGSRSSRAKPLHWTSCLKIAEDVAQGLAYMHQASRLVHGNLKSTNILLGPDFEACLTDNSLAAIADTSADDDDPIFSGYRAPETRKSSRRATQKADVYSFGVLLMELLTGKHPSQHPYLIPTDMPEWVRAMRDDDRMDDNHVEVLTELASFCSLASPEMRPTMPHVLRMIEEIKATAIMEDHVVDASRGFS